MSLEVKVERGGKSTINQKIFLLYPRTFSSLELPVYSFVPTLSNMRVLALKAKIFTS